MFLHKAMRSAKKHHRDYRANNHCALSFAAVVVFSLHLTLFWRFPRDPTSTALSNTTSNATATPNSTASTTPTTSTNTTTHALAPPSKVHLDPAPAYDSPTCFAIRRGRHHIPSCFRGTPRRLYPLLITSTGRSGTKFTAKVLSALDFDISHDNSRRIADDGAVSWPLAVRIPQPYWGIQAYHDERFRVLVHQTRDPLATIPSRAAFIHTIVEGFVATHTKAMEDIHPDFRANPLAVSLLHYVTWHRIIERQLPDFQFRVEDLNTETIEHIAQLAELDLDGIAQERMDEVLRAVDTETNSEHVRTHVDVTWMELFELHSGLSRVAFTMANRYGYKYDDDTAEFPENGSLDSLFVYNDTDW